MRLNALEGKYARLSRATLVASVALAAALAGASVVQGALSPLAIGASAGLVALNVAHVHAYGPTFGVIPTAALSLLPALGSAAAGARGLLRAALSALLAVGLLCALVFACYVVAFAVAAHLPRDAGRNRVYAVLGHSSATTNPTDELVWRLERALRAHREDPGARIVLSGGRTWGSDVSEAQLMADYLQSHGVPAGSLVLEDASTTTRENLENVREIMRRSFPTATLHVVTSDFHEFRALSIARELGLEAYPEAAPTPPLRLVQDWLREVLLVQSM
ncbi:MAG: YdcF family protein [Olsenella sp.]|nr:YdcF family protein [Olsenella sp.]